MTAPVASPNAPTSASTSATGASPLPLGGEGQGEGRPLLTEHFATIASAPNGIKKLRELILELAVQGKLLPQKAEDEPAAQLLTRAHLEKQRLIKEGHIRASKATAGKAVETECADLPLGWCTATLGSVALVNPRNFASDDVEVSFVPMTLIGTKFDGGHEQETRLWKEVKQGFTHFAEGDIGVAKITPCFENSKACVFSGLKNGIGAGTTELHVIRPLAGTLDPRYVLAYLKSPRFLTVGESQMTGTAGQKRLPKDFVESNPFPLPPLAEQRRIVAKVDELMALCDQLEAQQADAEAAHEKLVRELLATLTQSQSAADFQSNWQRLATNFDTLFTTEASIDALQKVILQLAVLGRLVPQVEATDSAMDLLRAIHEVKRKLSVEEGLRTTAEEEVPESDRYLGEVSGWEYCRLGNLAKFIDYRGRTPVKTESGVPLITAKNVRFGYISREPYEFIAEADYGSWMTRGFPRVGDILFTTEAPLGNVALIDIDERFALAQRVICLQLHVPEIGPFLRLALMSGLVQERIAQEATGMTATGIKASRLKEIPILVPPLSEQRRIVAKVDELISLCNQLMARVNNAHQLKERLASASIECALA